MNLSFLFPSLAELAVTLLSGVASVAIGFLTTRLKTKWGVEIESKHREALHSAIVSGINLALAKLAGQADKVKVPKTNNFITDMALEYVLKSVPDAIAKFGLTPERVQQMILAKIPQIAATETPKVAVASPTVPVPQGSSPPVVRSGVLLGDRSGP